MKEKAVIFECDADAIIDIRKRLDEIASVTNGSIWFETIGQNAIDGNRPSLTKYSIICHYPESQMEIIDKYYENKVRNIQNALEAENKKLKNEIELLRKYSSINAVVGSHRNDIDDLDRRIRTIEESLAWDKWKNNLPDICCSNRIESLCGEITAMDDRVASIEGEVEAIKESIGTDNLQEQLNKDFDDVYTEFQNTKDKVNDIEFGYIDWSSKMSSAIDEMEKFKKTVKGLNSLVATLGELNIRLKAIEKRLNIKPFYAPTEDEKDD